MSTNTHFTDDHFLFPPVPGGSRLGKMRRLLSDDPHADRVTGQGDGIPQIQLPHEVGPMIVHRPF